MSNATEVEAVPVIDRQITEALATFDPIAAGIAALAAKAEGLTIDGIDDREGHKAVSAVRKEAKSARVQVEKTRKELKADALKYGRAVDSKAKEITASLLEIEEPLHAQEKLIDEQRAERKAAEELAAKAVLDERVAMLQAVGAQVPVSTVADWGDEEYESMLAEYGARWAKQQEGRAAREAQEAQERAEAEAKAEAARKAEEAERAAAEAKDKAEREAAEAKLAEERKSLAAERAELDAERAKARKETEAKDRAEQEKRAAELQAEREAELAAKREKEAAELKAKQDAARPDAEKVRWYAREIDEINPPEIQDDEVRERAYQIVVDAQHALESLALELTGGQE